MKEIQGHMRLRASGDRHEVRQQYLPTLWYQLVQRLQFQGKDAVEDIIELMDSYFLTKDDWDALLELGVGPMNAEDVKIDSQTKSAFTRLYNQQSHPLPFMKASNTMASKKSTRDKPDLEEAIEESEDDDEPVANNDEDEEELDLKKDKYVKASKKRAPKKSAPKKSAPKKAPGKVKGKAKEEIEDDESEDTEESEEIIKPKKGRGSAKSKARK